LSTIWFGDLRCQQFYYWLSTADTSENNSRIIYADANNVFITEENADFSWLKINIVSKLQANAVANDTVLVALGLVDCINSCTWPEAIDIRLVAKNYAELIKSVIQMFSSSTIYFCSVNPVDSDCIGLDGRIITANELNNCIDIFNTEIAARYEDNFINSNKYLTNTNFKTRDGLHYEKDTCINILNYILNNITYSFNSNFNSRTTPEHRKPVLTRKTDEASGDGDAEIIDSANFWITSRENWQGFNPYPIRNTVPGYIGIGSSLPNCTAYAWGRFYEIIGEEPALYYGDAEMWYGGSATIKSDLVAAANEGTAYDGYKRGGPDDSPALGAIMCWENTEGTGGHVAIIEKLNADNNGGVEISESGYGFKTDIWNVKTVPKETNGVKWYYGKKYKFQGFIYCPTTYFASTGAPISKTQVTSNNTRLGTDVLETYTNINDVSESDISEEMKINAAYIWQYFGSRGWTLNAVAGMLGNLMAESTINPGIWQGGRAWGSADSHGYGLAQWTPYTKFTDWCKKNNYDMNDIDVALKRIELEVEASEKPGWQELDQWITTSTYDISFRDFTTSTKDAAWLAGAFLLNYERPLDQSADVQTLRGNNASYWYDYLSLQVVSAKKFIATNFKIDKKTPTTASVSFITRLSKAGSYQLFNSSGGLVYSGILDDMLTEDETLKIVTFTLKSLLPNHEYELKISVMDDLGEEQAVETTINFLTPQDYPEQIKSITLTCEDKIKSADSKFKLEVAKPEYLGYWEAKSGYDLQLFVNGKCVKTKTIDKVKNISESFTIEKKFGYKCKTDDTIQIGVRVWVKDDNNEYLYNNNSKTAKTSKPVCLLNKPIQMYLNR
jgi:surface antigen